VAHFHTYEILGVLVWSFAFLAHLLERDADRTSSRTARAWTICLILVGGYGLTGTWFVEGVLGLPRRYAIQLPGTSGYSLVGSIFALVLASGFLLLCVQLVQLARAGRIRRHTGILALAGGGAVQADGAGALQADGGEQAFREPVASQTARLEVEPARALTGDQVRDVPLATAAQLAVGVAAAVIGLAAFFPQIVHASEASIEYHHLDHAADFFFGVVVALALGSLPSVSRWLGKRESIGLAAVILAPTVMMLVMVPSIYEPLERHPFEHALYHLAMAAFGFITGLGATRLGRVTGRLAAFLAVGMAVMFAAAMS